MPTVNFRFVVEIRHLLEWCKFCLKPLLCLRLQAVGGLGRKGSYRLRFARPVSGAAPAPFFRVLTFTKKSPDK